MYKGLSLVLSILCFLTAVCYGLLAAKGVRSIVTRRCTKRTYSLIGSAAVRDGLMLTVPASGIAATWLIFSALFLFESVKP
jgi:hypothetical protein